MKFLTKVVIVTFILVGFIALVRYAQSEPQIRKVTDATIGFLKNSK